MSASIMLSSQPKKPFHHRNGSDELDVFEAAGYFSGVTENLRDTHKNISGGSNIFSNITQKYNMRPIRRMSLDMPNHRGNSSPLQARLMENPSMITKEKKFKQPSSPGGKLAHFLNSLFNQTSSKKSKSKKKSTKDEDESPGGWKRKRRSSMSHLSSANTTTTTTTTTTLSTATIKIAAIMSDGKSSFSTSTSSGFRTPPPYHVAHNPKKTTSYIDPISYAYLNPPPRQTTKIPLNENLNKIKTFNKKSDFPEKNLSFRNGYVEKVKNFDEKQEEHHPYEYISREDTKEFKKFNNDDEGADSDSSSDLFELTNCDVGYYSSGLPVYKTTHMNSIKTQERCTNVELRV